MTNVALERLMQIIFHAKVVKFSKIFIPHNGDFKNILNITWAGFSTASQGIIYLCLWGSQTN